MGLVVGVLSGPADTSGAASQPKQVSLQTWAWVYGSQFKKLVTDYKSLGSLTTTTANPGALKLLLDSSDPSADAPPWADYADEDEDEDITN